MAKTKRKVKTKRRAANIRPHCQHCGGFMVTEYRDHDYFTPETAVYCPRERCMDRWEDYYVGRD